MNYTMIGYTLGWVLNIEAICLMLSAVTALVYGEIFYLKYIALCIAACVVVGVALTHRLPKNKAMYSKEGFVTVALSWIVISIFGSLPFFLSGAIPNFIDAFFETVSGFTTTGASILRDVEALPKCLLFWRSFTHWIGGMGVLVFLVAILPLSGGSNLYLIKAESPGPSVSKIVPKVRQTAKIFYGIYIMLTLIEVILLLLGGINLFESLTLSFGTAGTGGFSILNSGISTYSPYVQWVITIFMIIFGVDFSLYYLILTRRIKDALSSEEFRAYRFNIKHPPECISNHSVIHYPLPLQAFSSMSFISSKPLWVVTITTVSPFCITSRPRGMMILPFLLMQAIRISRLRESLSMLTPVTGEFSLILNSSASALLSSIICIVSTLLPIVFFIARINFMIYSAVISLGYTVVSRSRPLIISSYAIRSILVTILPPCILLFA